MTERRLAWDDLIGAEICNIQTDGENLSEILGMLVKTRSGDLAEVYINGTGEYMKATVQEVDVNE